MIGKALMPISDSANIGTSVRHRRHRQWIKLACSKTAIRPYHFYTLTQKRNLLSMLKLMHHWKSSASRRVRLCLAEKNLPYEGILVNLLEGQHNTPEFLALNPNGVVPLLIDGSRVIYESSTICEYLDELYPRPRLRPNDPYETASMRNFVRWIDDKVIGKLIIFNWTDVHQPTCEKWSDEELERRLKSVPSPERREMWLRVARRPFTAEEKAAAMAVLVDLLDKMSGLLADKDWLFGDNYSIGELGAIPFVARIEEINPTAIAERPLVAHWWKRVKARPSYTTARILAFLAPAGLEEEVEAKEQRGVVPP